MPHTFTTEKKLIDSKVTLLTATSIVATKKDIVAMSTKKLTDFTLTTYSTTLTNENRTVAKHVIHKDPINTGVIIGVSIASFIALIILIYAIYYFL